MRPLSGELKKLNADTYRAEAREGIDKGSGQKESWKTFLQRVLLAPHFRIIRGSGKVQNKDEMIDQIQKEATPHRRNPMGEPEGYEEGALGVVISVVTLPDDPVNQRDSFQNLKVFIQQANDWKCVYWQVTRLPGG